MDRRRFLGASLASSMVLLAGCSDTEDMIEDANESNEDGLGGEQGPAADL